MNGGFFLKLALEERIQIQQKITGLKEIIAEESERILLDKLSQRGVLISKEKNLVKYKKLNFKYLGCEVSITTEDNLLIWQVEMKLSQSEKRYVSNCIWLTLTSKGTEENFDVKLYSNCEYSPNSFRFNNLDVAVDKALEIMEEINFEVNKEFIYA